MERLSSNYLFHYKRDINVVKLILEYGFRYSMWDEKVLFRDSVQQNFVVCFCDIIAEQADYHKKCYGGISIALTKDWGIRNNVSPVRYVHESSPSQTLDYIKIKNINRYIRGVNSSNSDLHQYAYDYLLFALARYKGHMTGVGIQESANNNPDWDNQLGELDNELDSLMQVVRQGGKEDLFNKYLSVFGSILGELHNELETRDSLVRVYQGDFKSPATGEIIKDKILYDEREWRAVKFISGQDFTNDPSEYSQAVTNGFLPPRLNLKFSNDDCVAILVDSKEEKSFLIDYISKANGQCLVHDADKVKLYSDFHE